MTEDEQLLLAQMGDTITCENGHEIMDAAHDLPFEGLILPESFTNLRVGIDQLKVGEKIPACPCGAPFLRIRSCFGRLHVNGGWEPFFQISKENKAKLAKSFVPVTEGQ